MATSVFSIQVERSFEPLQNLQHLAYFEQTRWGSRKVSAMRKQSLICLFIMRGYIPLRFSVITSYCYNAPVPCVGLIPYAV